MSEPFRNALADAFAFEPRGATEIKGVGLEETWFLVGEVPRTRPAAQDAALSPPRRTAGAKVLGVTRQALNNLVNERAGISPEMAIRLEKAFGSSADMWLRLQLSHDLAQARKREGEIAVRRYRAPRRRAA